ncbi:MAG: ATP-grasp domain-containing protein [Planctomycetes bacterium]|jgi:glutathione synthase/RimK-type ligase-like ATP-grasp enzyme|nr:ATP-grasp domain-containing protein [Planctomycetota bacterium]
MKKHTIGFIYAEKFLKEADIELLRKELYKVFTVVDLPLEKQFNITELARQTKDCRLVVNYGAYGQRIFEGIELSKTLEELGLRVINSTHSFYYQEDKWMFYLKCLEYKLPTPKTYFMPVGCAYNNDIIKKIVRHKTVVIKSIFSDNCYCVERARDFNEYNKKVKKILDKNKYTPLIAQEYIPNNKRSYRVTLVGYKAKQGIVKYGKRWIQSGHYDSEHFRTFKIDSELRNICERAARALNLEICGLDLIYNKRWYIIEANSCPGLTFIDYDMLRLVKAIVGYIKKQCEVRRH